MDSQRSVAGASGTSGSVEMRSAVTAVIHFERVCAMICFAVDSLPTGAGARVAVCCSRFGHDGGGGDELWQLASKWLLGSIQNLAPAELLFNDLVLCLSVFDSEILLCNVSLVAASNCRRETQISSDALQPRLTPRKPMRLLHWSGHMANHKLADRVLLSRWVEQS